MACPGSQCSRTPKETGDPCLFSRWLSGITGLNLGTSACNSISLTFFGRDQDLSGAAGGAARKLEAGGPSHMAVVNVCDASHSSCPSKVSWPLSSPISPWILVLTPLPAGPRTLVIQFYLSLRGEGQRAMRPSSFLERVDFLPPSTASSMGGPRIKDKLILGKIKGSSGKEFIPVIYQLFGVV